jgi:membrane protein
MTVAQKKKRSMTKRILRRIAFSTPVISFRDYTKRKNVPGFDNLAIYDVADFYFTGIHRGSIITRAQSLAFSFFLALFPAVIFLFSLIPYVPVRDFQDQLLELIQGFLPHNAYQAMRGTIEDIIKHQRGGLLSLGFLFALYLTTNAFMAMMRSFNSSYHVQEKRTPFKQRIVAINLTLILSVLLIVATAIIVFSEMVTIYFVKHHVIKTHTQLTLIFWGKWLVVVALFLTAISFLYYYAPALSKKWKFISAGSTFATIMAVVTSIGFAYFVNHFGKYNKVYGSIGTLIVIMLWIYINSLILLLGFELNASIDQAKKGLNKGDHK